MPTSAAKRKGGGSKSTPSGSGNDRSYSDVVNTPGTSTPMRRAPSYSDIDLIIKFEPHLVYGDKWAAGWNTAYDIILNVGSVSGLLTESGAIVANPSACLCPPLRMKSLINVSLLMTMLLSILHRSSSRRLCSVFIVVLPRRVSSRVLSDALWIVVFAKTMNFLSLSL